MKAEEIKIKIAEMLENTQSDNDFTDEKIEHYKSKMIDIAKNLIKKVEKEQWLDADICLNLLSLNLDKAIERELEITRGLKDAE